MKRQKNPVATRLATEKNLKQPKKQLQDHLQLEK
jgi:hypothetical protein